jgi:formylglycine-generating enzyme required for sulfatase activity
MRFIDGPSLGTWVADNPLDARGAALLVQKLALAMQAAHDGGVIHRDLKPGNVAMDRSGEPIVLDFGLARLVDARTHSSQHGAVFGTPTHMAPEQATGDPDAIGPATDVYALGVILYELLTGALPFTGPPSHVIAQVLSAPPRAPRRLNPEVPETLEAVCLKAMAKKPEDRFASMRAFADALAEAVGGLPAASDSANPPAPLMPPATATDSWRLPLSSHDAGPPPPPTLPLTRRPRRRAVWLAVALAGLLLVGLAVGVWVRVRAHRSADDPEKKAGPVTRVEPDAERRPTDNEKKDDTQGRAIVGKQRADPLGMKFVKLPKGTFYVGWEGPRTPGKKTEIKEDFEIAVHTVTQEQWAALTDGDDRYPSKFRRGGEHARAVEKISDADLKRFPVENVSWLMVQEYIKRLNAEERGTAYLYRLPTEAEWEYACRGGATSQAECSFHYYLDIPTNFLSTRLANLDGKDPVGNAAGIRPLNRPTMVDDPAYLPNRLGLTHMHGNVWQWCADVYDAEGLSRVTRGGAWDGSASDCRAANRSWGTPTVRSDNIGFRLARVRVP